MGYAPLPGWPIGCIPWPVWPVGWGPNQAKLSGEHPGGRGLSAGLCRWAEQLAEISAQMPLQRGTWSAKIWVLVPETLNFYLIPIGHAPHVLPVIPWRGSWVRLPRSVLQCWGSWMTILGSLFPTRKTVGPGGLYQSCTVSAWRRGDTVKVKLHVLPF